MRTYWSASTGLGRSLSTSSTVSAADVRNPGLMGDQGIHVALDHDRQPLALDRGARRVDRVQRGALAEERRIRRIQVLRLSVAHRAAAEADHGAARVADGEDDPATEA